MSERPTAACPHPDCRAMIPIPPEAPAGDGYWCICKIIRVRLSWAQYIEAPHRRPYLEQA